jgi:hypothetical protein
MEGCAFVPTGLQPCFPNRPDKMPRLKSVAGYGLFLPPRSQVSARWNNIGHTLVQGISASRAMD